MPLNMPETSTETSEPPLNPPETSKNLVTCDVCFDSDSGEQVPLQRCLSVLQSQG